MAAGSTYTPIATTTLGTAQSSVSFSSFSGYTDLVLVSSTKAATSDQNIAVRFSSDAVVLREGKYILKQSKLLR
jgi:hypothetical protein